MWIQENMNRFIWSYKEGIHKGILQWENGQDETGLEKLRQVLAEMTKDTIQVIELTKEIKSKLNILDNRPNQRFLCEM